MIPPTNTEGAVTDVAAIARGLSPGHREFLARVCEGRKPGIADRADDRVRQSLRRAGLVQVVQNPRRWVAKPAGQAVYKHLTEQGVTAS